MIRIKLKQLITDCEIDLELTLQLTLGAIAGSAIGIYAAKILSPYLTIFFELAK